MSIWNYKSVAKEVTPEFQLTQGEGDTALEEVVIKPVGSEEILIYLKREDMNPNGSFKDRSLAFQISHYMQKGVKDLVISSTGNAAISAASYAKQAGINLHIFISEDIEASKMKRLEMVVIHGDVNIANSKESKIEILKSKKPKSDAIKFAKEKGFVNLRGSMDETALSGFKTLGYEIAKVADMIDSVFIPCSSGTSTVGVYAGLKEVLSPEMMPRINIVQTNKIHPMAGVYDKDFVSEEMNAADAISDRVANRLSQVKEAIDSTNGFGWVISTTEVKEAKNLLAEKGVNVSNAAALSVAGIIKASRLGRLSEKPLAIISGL